MRIIAGKYRGRTLATFKGEEIRPTSDRVKESVFQILSARIPGARVLDLFCGSGALGIECLSRGAAAAVFNDVRAESLSLLEKNLARVAEPREIYRLDFRTYLESASGAFDLIFSDPPYRADFLPEIARLVARRSLLKEGGLLVHESEREQLPPEGWELSDVRRYGRTVVSFFARSKG